MFVRPGSLALSFFIHFAIFILFLLFYSNREIMVAEPVKKVVVSLVLQQKQKPGQVLPESVSPATAPASHEVPAAISGTENPVQSEERQPDSEMLRDVDSNEIRERIDENPSVSKIEQQPEPAVMPFHDSDETDIYYLSQDIPLPDDDGPDLLNDAPLLADLLIDDTVTGEDNSLFSLELESAESRKILSRPEIVFDSRDPILATLENCRLRFTITKEGFVRETSMIPPGSGSISYDEIIEDLLSQFLFEPGRKDSGVIRINFYRVKEGEDE